MPDAGPVLERIGKRVPVPLPAFDRLVRRRDRKRRNQRITAGVLGLAIALATIAVGANVIRSTPRPADEPPPLTRGTIAFTSLGVDDSGPTVDYSGLPWSTSLTPTERSPRSPRAERWPGLPTVRGCSSRGTAPCG